ncbi:hypothetical protein PVAND_011107 [Polypedilum vanderplanki]|uniref:Reverse transcriptase n=1 Tax=Polypedilum vanderplanki TaxID=319348 RepID=A0A9J6CHM3_POLVA|nr:hypothetical protein PVAND_011107 [Polypedilum vanderplanki]
MNESSIAFHFNNFFTNSASDLINNISINKNDRDKFHSNEKYDIQYPFICASCSQDEISLIIDKLKSSTTLDFYGLSNNFVKIHKKALIPILTELINVHFIKGQFPEVLKVGVVNPLFKNGSKTDVSNYRPVVMLPVFGKIFERVIYNRLSQYIHEK